MPDDSDTHGARGNGSTTPQADSFQAIAELSRGFWASRLLISAVELDLFTTLGGQSLTAAQLATRLDADERGVEILSNALVALGFLDVEEERYSSTSLSRLYLDGTSPDYRGHVVRLAGHWWDQWSALTTVVREGAEAVTPMGDNALEDFTLAMHQGKPLAGETLVAKLDLHGVERIVDLGGGPGTFSHSLAEALPDAQVVLIDRPEVIDIARRHLPAELLDQRIVLVEQDFMSEGIALAGDRPEPYDLALVSSVLHLQGPRENAALLRRVYDALEPGGQIAIREFLTDDSGTSPAASALFAVTMLVGTTSGRCYSFRQVRDWLHAAGFGEVEQHDFDGAVELVTARRA